MRILMLGNSLTSTHGLPETLARLVGAEVVAHTRGGARLSEHLNPDTRLGEATQRALRDEQWDFVVMQESSNGPIVHRKAFLRAAERLCAQVREAGAAPILYCTWAYRRGSDKLAKMGMSYEEMTLALRDAYDEAASIGGAVVANVGAPFLKKSDIDSQGNPDPAGLYAEDGCHPTEAGALLAAQTIADTIRSANPEKTDQ